MVRRRLRPAHDAATLARLYARPYRSAERGPDHVERVATTAGLVAGVMRRHQLSSLADLSAGDGELARTVGILVPHTRLWLGDLVPAPGLDVTGPIEDTITSFRQVDLFLCSETLEHLDDPDRVLQQVRERARWLVCSTPIAEQGTGNPEHYWGWDADDVRAMLEDAGWEPQTFGFLAPRPTYYTYQLWAAR
jgi:hypothetical protein